MLLKEFCFQFIDSLISASRSALFGLAPVTTFTGSLTLGVVNI